MSVNSSLKSTARFVAFSLILSTVLPGLIAPDRASAFLLSSSVTWTSDLALTTSDTVNVDPPKTAWTFANLDQSETFNTFSAVTNTSTLSYGVSNRLSQVPVQTIEVSILNIDTSNLIAPASTTGLSLAPRSQSPLAFSVSGDVQSQIYLSTGVITGYDVTVNPSSLFWRFYVQESAPTDFEGDFVLHILPGELTKTTTPGKRVKVVLDGTGVNQTFSNYKAYEFQSPRWVSENFADTSALNNSSATPTPTDLTYEVSNAGGYSISEISYVFNGFDASALTSISAISVGTQPAAGAPYRISLSGQAEMDFWVDSGTLETFSARVDANLGQIQLELKLSGASAGEWRGVANLKVLAGELTTLAGGGNITFYVYGRTGFDSVYYGDLNVRGLGVQSPAPNNNSNQSLQQPNSNENAAPAYAGPIFSGLAGAEAKPGEKLLLRGERLDQVGSITLGGIPIKLRMIDSGSIELEIPTELGAGLYDLVITSPSGRLTQIGAISIPESEQEMALATTSKNEIAEQVLASHAAFSKKQGLRVDSVICLVNAKSDEAALADAQRLCDAVVAANPRITNVKISTSSTVTDNHVHALVKYGIGAVAEDGAGTNIGGLGQDGRVSVNLTNRNLLSISQENMQEHLDFSLLQDKRLNKIRCIVNSRDSDLAARQAQELCDLIRKQNSHIETAVVEARSTVPFRMTYARVIYGWN